MTTASIARAIVTVAALAGAGACGGGGGQDDVLAGVTSCNDASQALVEVIEARRARHLSCVSDADCSGVWKRIDRDDVNCMDHGCLWSIAETAVDDFSRFLASDPAITALCGYLHEGACRRVTADCFPVHASCDRGSCTFVRAPFGS